MDRSVAQGGPDDPQADGPAETLLPARPGGPSGLGLARRSDGRRDLVIGAVLAVIALAVYLATQTDRFYDHFVWQAAAFLEGQAAIRYPVEASAANVGNTFFQDVLPVASSDAVPRGLIPFPPLPAIILVPFVAAWGLSTDDQTIFTFLAAVDVALCWWLLGRLRVQPVVRLATTMFFSFGTVFWYAAQLATTWYQAHIVAVGFSILAVGVALGADPRAQDDELDPTDDQPPDVTVARAGFAIDRRQFVVGLLFGLAATARLTILFAAPFFILVGSGGSWWRRSWSAGLGAAIPVAVLLAYNVAVTGHVFHPAYDHLYRLEARAYTALHYHPEWAAEDPRYIAQNLGIMFLSTPEVLPERLRDTLGTIDEPLCTTPGAQRGLFDPDCPLAMPRDIGMSILLTSPAFLLLVPALRRYGRSRLVTGAALAVLLVVVIDLMHFSQGWVQFGYRFSNDAVPFALPLVALGLDRVARDTRRWAMPAAMALVGVSIAVNAWGVVWARQLGW
ncbi:MAG TPA: hypothetical protein VM408_00200 [Methylomirabilota bacterium]|nr:hypothetical protein [Methylomirabilota bacterium]